MIPIQILAAKRDLSAILKMAKYGIIALLAYFAFIIYIFFENVTSQGFHDKFKKLHYFSTDFGLIAGVFALAFFGHNFVPNVLATNANPKNNIRDLRIGFIGVYIIYGIVGFFGGIGILGVTDLKVVNIIS